MFNIIRFP